MNFLLLLALAGCAGSAQPKSGAGTPGASAAADPTAPTAAPTSDQYTVNAPHALFYRYGPAQADGANFALPKGAAVTMLSRQPIYSRVRTRQGQEGYVATDLLTLLPPPPSVAVSPPLPVPAFRFTSQRLFSDQLKVVPVDQMLQMPQRTGAPLEPPLPTGGGPVLQ